MPELPEVETQRRQLATWATGRRIVAVTPPPGRRETGGVAPDRFARRLRGHTVERVERRGKWLLVALSGGAGRGPHLARYPPVAARRARHLRQRALPALRRGGRTDALLRLRPRR